MNIGTSKPTVTQRKKVKHCLLNLVTPDKMITLYDWQRQAKKAINNIIKKCKLPFLVGGTGLYLSSIIDNYKIPQKKRECPYEILILGVHVPRHLLYQRINKRVDEMVQAGLEKEVRKLTKKYAWQLPSMHGIGYREWKQYFEGKATREHVISKIKQHTRNFAKRQMTWFRNMIEKRHTIRWISTHKQAEHLLKTFF